MKKTILLLTAAIAVAKANAQNNLYVLPSVGAGISNIHQTYQSPVFPTEDIKNDAVFNYNAQLLLGYQFRHFVVETGAQYLTTGNSQKLVFATILPPQPQPFYTNTRYKYTSITIPVQVGYEIPISPMLSLTPTLGVNIGFNTSQQYTYTDIDDVEHKSDLSHDLYGNDYKKTSIWGNAGARLSYKLSERIAIVGGPAFQYMLNNFTKDPVLSTVYKSSQRNYSLDFNLGVKVNVL